MPVRLLLVLLVAALAPARAEAQDRPLALRALVQADAGDVLGGWRTLRAELGEAVASGSWDTPRARAEGQLAALTWLDLTRRLDLWPEAVGAVGGWLPYPAAVPWEVRSVLEAARAEGLRNIGRYDDARGVTDDRGVVARYVVIGPFDNERGGGFDSPYPPEVDLGPMEGEFWDPAWERLQPVPGKSRDVAWRANPGRHHPLGRILLHEIMRPNRQVVAYLGTMLVPEIEREVVLRIGSTGPVKVFLNGRLVFSRNVERPHGADQDRVVLALAAGPNQLLLKLAVEEGAWTFESRLTALDGRPLVDVPTTILEFGPPVAPARAAEGVAAPEAREWLDERMASDDPRAEDAMLLALYHLLVHPDDIVDRSARAAAEVAVKLLPEDPQAWFLLARANAPEGASRHEMEVNRRLAALDRTLELDPSHVSALLDLAEFSMHESPLPDRADELTGRAVEAAPDSWSTLMARARFLDWRGRPAEADRMRKRAESTEEAGVLVAGLLARARRLHEEGDTDGEWALLRIAVERRFVDGPAVDRLIRLAVDRHDHATALDLTNRVLWGAPFSTGRLLSTARLLERTDQGALARELVETALSTCPENVEALMDRARFQERDGDVEGMKETLEKVLELEPGQENARRRLGLLRAPGDGEGADFDEPWRRDAVELASRPLPDDGDESLEVLDRTKVWSVQPDGTEHGYEHIVWRALNSRGVKQLDTVVIPEPVDGSLQVYNVRVIHPDGTFQRAPALRRRETGVRRFDVPPLSVGDIVDVEYRTDQTEAGVFGEYFGYRHAFYPDSIDGLAPTRRSELVVIAPADVPLYVAERNAEELESSMETDADGGTVRRWVATDLPRPQIQSSMPQRVEFAPVVEVTTYESWDAFADWWWSLIEKEFVTTPAMREKVAELTAGLQTEEEQVAAIARFVAQDIRYNAWPFGTHGYEPFSAATIFDRRFGDCKDKSILMRQMLQEIGVESIPVLIRAEYFRPEEPLDSAMVEHFNHCISYVLPNEWREGYYLDATADLNPVEYLRADDQGARVLHVSEDGGQVHDIPYTPPERNARRRRLVLDLDEEGAADVELNDESSGMYGVRLRQRYGGEQGDIETLLARELRSAFGSVVVADVETSDLEDTSSAAWLRVRFRAQGLWSPQGDERSLPMMMETLDLTGVANEAPSERTFEVVLDRPFIDESVNTWNLPPGSVVTRLPAEIHIERPGLIEYHQWVEQEGDTVEVHRRFELKQRRVGIADYASFRDALREVQQAERRTILIEPPGRDS